jgi:hypothetical protein
MRKFWENPVSSITVPQNARVPESLQIGNVRIAPATVLAPMAGVTDTVFRRFIRHASRRRELKARHLPGCRRKMAARSGALTAKPLKQACRKERPAACS